MSGHSKWATIKRAKGMADAKRSNTFTKIANAITIAAKLGNSRDPEGNPRLRMAIDAARAVNMPKENIQRAIDRGLGKLPGQALEEVIYEGFGPSRVAIMVEAVTDNRLRTLQEVKNIFDRAGGLLVQPGAVSYMFDKVGEIKVASKGMEKNEEILELIDLGVLDVEEIMQEGQQKYLVYTESPELNTMGNKITQAGYRVESSELVYKPNTLVEIKEKDDAVKVLEFSEKIENLDDVQKVFANYDITEELVGN